IRAGHVTGVQTCALPILVPVTRETGPRFLFMGRPVSDVVATHVHAVDDYMLVSALGKVSLYRLICAVRIADEHREILLHDVLQRSEERRVGQECRRRWIS